VADRESLLGYVLLVVTAIGWSGAWITARLAAHEAPELTVTVGRFALAGLALLPVWWVTDRGRDGEMSREDWGLVAGMSLTGITTYTVLFLTGVGLAPATDGAVITPGFVGLSSVLIAWVFFREAPTRPGLAGAVIALLGALAVGWTGMRGAGFGSARATGDLVFVAAGAAYGTYTVLGERLSDSVPPVTAILLASTLGALGLAPIALVVDGVPQVAAWSWRAWLNVAYLGLVATALSFVTYYAAVQRIGVERTAPALGLVPVFTVVGASVLLDDPLTWLHALGGLLVLAGIVLPAWARTAGSSEPGGDEIAAPGEAAET
jgi:drug/metabolite transporter (DMT)-like permease